MIRSRRVVESERPVKTGLPVESPSGTDSARRTFLKVSIAVLSSLMGIVLGIPFVSSLVRTGGSKTKKTWSKVTELEALPEGRPVRLNFTAEAEEAYRREERLYSVWLLRRSPSEVIAFSPICTHLGCYYNWNPGSDHFECPCHASSFSIDGRVLAGPAPRPLDTLPLKIEKGVVYVTWERFKVGMPEKIPAQEALWYRESGTG